MTSNESTIAGIAGAIGSLIKVIADMIGEPVEDVRKRVLDRIKADAVDPSDETDKVADALDADMPDASER